MLKKILIDSYYPEETKFFVVDDKNELNDFDYYHINHKTLKGNIYLGKVIKIEPSLQSVFIDCGIGKKGFLSLEMIHPKYYNIHIDNNIYLNNNYIFNIINSRYKIQELLKKDQVILVQVEKEEKGDKGVFLTTYISISGRYCIFSPNTLKPGFGISKEINDLDEMERLKTLSKILLNPYKSSSLLLRTSSFYRNKSEIISDFNYLIKIWFKIKKMTLLDKIPSIVYESSNLIINNIYNFFNNDICKIIVSGDHLYFKIKNFFKNFMPNNIKKLEKHENNLPLIYKYNLRNKFKEFLTNKVKLNSGGYLVINITEALISIDVNSGKYNEEYNFEETACKTNLEALEIISKQIKFRGLYGLIIIDFIDMLDERNRKIIEEEFRKLLWHDKARIQCSEINEFGLFEMTRQRIGCSFFEKNSVSCFQCNGQGNIISKSLISLFIIDNIKFELLKKNIKFVYIFANTDIVMYIINYRKKQIIDIENKYLIEIIFLINNSLTFEEYKLRFHNNQYNYIVKNNNFCSSNNKFIYYDENMVYFNKLYKYFINKNKNNSLLYKLKEKLSKLF